MEKPAIQPGDRIGRWTVQASYVKTSKGEKKWLCRCQCGTERYVLERSLKHGGSFSCGCLRKEKAEETNVVDLTGQTFGDLTVECRADNQKRNGGVWWFCRCSCGKTYECPGSLLMTGRRTHCGCKTDRGRPTDITGQRFYRLRALYMLPDRDQGGSVIWHCRCDCDKEIDIPYNTLVYTGQRSCGCQKKEHDKILSTFLNHVDGTSVEMIRSKKIPTDNTTGYRGVYRVGNRYLAKIVFQRKQYHLGYYDKIEDAAKARHIAESVLFDEVTEYYEEYSRRAAADPQWAKENPMQIEVSKDSADLSVRIEPDLYREER